MREHMLAIVDLICDAIDDVDTPTPDTRLRALPPECTEDDVRDAVRKLRQGGRR
jgi:hypothetical protein